MPEFTPTQWMLKTHSAKGEEPWKIYAECVREAIAVHGGFLLENRPIREKLLYENFIYGYKDEITIDGKTFTYPAQP